MSSKVVAKSPEGDSSKMKKSKKRESKVVGGSLAGLDSINGSTIDDNANPFNMNQSLNDKSMVGGFSKVKPRDF